MLAKTNSEKTIALVFGLSSNLTFALANTLLGLKKYSPNLLENVIVYHDGISDIERELLNDITPCNFILYNFSEAASTISQDALHSYTPMMFARYECFKLLEDYDIVVWNDVDILVQADITSMIKKAGTVGLGMCPVPRDQFINAHNFKNPVPGFNMDSDLYISALLVLSRNLPNWEVMHDWLYETTLEYGGYLRWPDQGILNMLLQKFAIQAYKIALEEYGQHPYDVLTKITEEDEKKNSILIKSEEKKEEFARIIHSNGPEKFWNSPLYYMGFPEWRENNREWSLLLSRRLPASPAPLISVVMPTMNAEHYLEDAVASILEQSLADFELLVIDGGSTDKTLDILQAFRDRRITVINDDTPGGNISTSLNIGLKQAKGKYIARMDADDIALPYRLQQQYSFLEKHPEISLCSASAHIFQDSFVKLQATEDPQDVYCRLLLGTPIVHPTVMWRRADFELHNLCYDPSYSANEDLELWQRATQKLKFSAVPQTLLMYRDHGSKVSKLGTYYKTRDIQVELMGRSFEALGAPLSRDALLVIDQRDNSPFFDDRTLTTSFAEFCRAIRRICRTQRAYPKRQLGRVLLGHLRYIFFSRLDPRALGGKNYVRAAFSIVNSCGLWGEVFQHKFWWFRYKSKVVKKLKSKAKPGKIGHKFFFHPFSTLRHFASLGRRVLRKLKGPAQPAMNHYYNELLIKVFKSPTIKKYTRTPLEYRLLPDGGRVRANGLMTDSTGDE